MTTARVCRVFLPGVLAALVLCTTGCSSRPAAAQRLFEKGRYQQVIERYSDLEIARRAEAKLAEQLVAEKKYDEVLAKYPNTPAAYMAREGMAQKLYDEGKYQAVLDSFPNSKQAGAAKIRLADSLFATGQIDLLIQRFADTPIGKEAKEGRAAEEFARIKKLRGTERRQALERMVSQYAGTPAATEANVLLTKARQDEAQKRKK